MRDAAQMGQVNQQTPWGSQVWSGNPGDPNRTLTTTLNPADQYRLDQQRNMRNMIIYALMGGQSPPQAGGGGQPPPQAGGGQPPPPQAGGGM